MTRIVKAPVLSATKAARATTAPLGRALRGFTDAAERIASCMASSPATAAGQARGALRRRIPMWRAGPPPPEIEPTATRTTGEGPWKAASEATATAADAEGTKRRQERAEQSAERLLSGTVYTDGSTYEPKLQVLSRSGCGFAAGDDEGAWPRPCRRRRRRSWLP